MILQASVKQWSPMGLVLYPIKETKTDVTDHKVESVNYFSRNKSAALHGILQQTAPTFMFFPFRWQ